jgi:hypothetical protein
VLHQIFRSSHRTGAAEEGELETHAVRFPMLGGRIGLTCWRAAYLIHINTREGDRD